MTRYGIYKVFYWPNGILSEVAVYVKAHSDIEAIEIAKKIDERYNKVEFVEDV